MASDLCGRKGIGAYAITRVLVGRKLRDPLGKTKWEKAQVVIKGLDVEGRNKSLEMSEGKALGGPWVREKGLKVPDEDKKGFTQRGKYAGGRRGSSCWHGCNILHRSRKGGKWAPQIER